MLSSITDHKGEIVKETLWNFGFQIANELGQPPTYQGYIGNESNIDITALKGTQRQKDKLEGDMRVTNEISSDHNIIELDLDISTDRKQVKLKRPLYNLWQADWKKL